jgi:hypothetical protein
MNNFGWFGIDAEIAKKAEAGNLPHLSPIMLFVFADVR